MAESDNFDDIVDNSKRKLKLLSSLVNLLESTFDQEKYDDINLRDAQKYNNDVNLLMSTISENISLLLSKKDITVSNLTKSFSPEVNDYHDQPNIRKRKVKYPPPNIKIGTSGIKKINNKEYTFSVTEINKGGKEIKIKLEDDNIESLVWKLHGQYSTKSNVIETKDTTSYTLKV